MNEALSRQSITVRHATEEDADAIARLAADLGYPNKCKAMRPRVRIISVSLVDLLLVAANSAGELFGWLQAHSSYLIESGSRVEIVGLIVSPTARRTGIGRSLIRAAESWATSIQAEAIVVRSNVKRVESHAFYPAVGFSAIKTQHVYRKHLISSLTNDRNDSRG